MWGERKYYYFILPLVITWVFLLMGIDLLALIFAVGTLIVLCSTIIKSYIEQRNLNKAQLYPFGKSYEWRLLPESPPESDIEEGIFQDKYNPKKNSKYKFSLSSQIIPLQIGENNLHLELSPQIKGSIHRIDIRFNDKEGQLLSDSAKSPVFWDVIDIDEFSIWDLDVRCKGSKRGIIIGGYKTSKKIHKRKAVDYLIEIETFNAISELYISLRLLIDGAEPEWIRLKCKIV